MEASSKMEEIGNFPEIIEKERSLGPYEEIKSSVREEYWKHIAGVPIRQAVDHWFGTLSVQEESKLSTKTFYNWFLIL